MRPAGSTFAAFLSRGTSLALPGGAPLSRSRAAAAAALLGIAFLSGAAHAQTYQGQWGGDGYRSAPFAQPAYAPGYAAPGYAAPGYAAPGYAPGTGAVQPPGYGSPGYAPPAYAAPGYAQPGYDGAPPPAARGYHAEDMAPATYVAGKPQPIDPNAPRMRDIDSYRKTVTLGGETMNAQDVMATIAAARAVGVTPAALLALQSRSAEAMHLAQQSAGEDDPNAKIDGPYAYSLDRWHADLGRFGPSIGVTGAADKITGGPTGNPDAESSALNSLRGDYYVAGLMAAADMASNDAAYRQAFGAGPTMAELVIGHHVGRPAMLKLSQILRTAPQTPLASVVRPNYEHDLIVLTGLSQVAEPPGGWTVGNFIGTIDNALKNSLTRYAAADHMALPPDYKPTTYHAAQAHATGPAAYDENVGLRPGGPR